jgi:hypothetical protein
METNTLQILHLMMEEFDAKEGGGHDDGKFSIVSHDQNQLILVCIF